MLGKMGAEQLQRNMGDPNMVDKRFVLSVSLAALGMTAGVAQAACNPRLAVVEIDIVNMVYQPADVEVCVNQKIRWVNKEPTSPRRVFHTVTADAAVARNPESVRLPAGVAPFKSALIAPGQSFEYTPTVVGEYKYFCQPHETMGHLGRFRVVAAPPEGGEGGEEGGGE
jgi:plastocyanin